MEEKKLSYSVHIHGELEEAISCPMGTYYVDVEHHLYYFEVKEGLSPKEAKLTSVIVAVLAAHKDIETAKAVVTIHEHFEELRNNDVKKDGDKYLYDFYIEGEMDAFVTQNELGILYGDTKKEVFFFDCKHKGFMVPILEKKFFEGIKEDLDNKDEEIRIGAAAVMEIHDNWIELDEEDIVR